MLVQDPNGLVTLECDSPGCKASHSIVGSSSDPSGNILLIMRFLIDNRWFNGPTNGEKVTHYCNSCGKNVESATPFYSSAVNRGSIGSESFMVSAQSLREDPTRGFGKVIDTDEAKRVRDARIADIKRGTPGLSDLDDAKRDSMKNSLMLGKKLFGDF